ncbi:MAG: non-ribosomal peptide synthetase, partial [Waterburya sp.]
TPLFQVMFAFQDAPQLATMPGLTLSEYKVDSQIAQFDLSVSIENRNETLIASFEYNTDLFDDATITRMVSHYQNLLEGIVINPQSSLSELPLLSDQERQQLLIDWNPIVDDAQVSIQELFEKQVEETPNGVAVIFEEEQLTYQELNQRAEQLAIYLQSIGVKPEVIVGICIERSLEVIIAILGILKAGGAYLPLDPAYPQERINLIIEDAQISLLLTTQHLIAQLSTKSVQAIAIDTEWHNISQHYNHNLTRYVNGDNLAYVIYTSGSTGKPKGVAIAHRSLVNFVQAAVQKYEINNRDRVLQFSTINFDASVEEIYPCLISGGTLVLRTEEMGYSPSLLLQKCRDYGITILDLPTAFWHLLTMQLESDPTLELSSSIRLVIIGGETVNRDKVVTWNRLVGKSCQLINTYGPTEATVVATSYSIPFQTDYLSSIYIGKPLPNVQVYILDQNLQPVPI